MPATSDRSGQARAPTGRWSIKIVKRSDAHRWCVLPKRWIVERASDTGASPAIFERYSRSVAAWVRLAMIRIMLQHLDLNFFVRVLKWKLV